MSTIGSNSEDLILNADGGSSTIKLKINGTEKASVSSAGAFTSTTIDATKLTGNLPAISGANLTGISDSSDYRPLSAPLIVNGDMQVAQRGTSFSHADNNGNNWPVDRFNFNTGSVGVYTSTQESLTSGAAFEAGFKKAARIDCTTIGGGGAGDYFYVEYKIEAQDCLAFKKGTSNAETMTVAFWVKSNKTGTQQLTVKDGDNDRICAGTYTTSSANTWEHKVINIAADTSGTFNNDNGAGYIFEWWLGGGSTYTSGTAPTAWEARADADRGANNLAINDNVANDWAITGVQVEVGTYTAATLPPFQFERYGDNLTRCKRYYQHYYGNAQIHPGRTISSNRIDISYAFPVEMRADPTLEATDISQVYTSGQSPFNPSNPTIAAVHISTDGLIIRRTCSESVTANEVATGQITTLRISAEV